MLDCRGAYYIEKFFKIFLKKYAQYNTQRTARQENIKKIVQYNTHRDSLAHKFTCYIEIRRDNLKIH